MDDDDLLDGCDIPMEHYADDEETAALRPLFPDGVAHDRWVGVDFHAS